MSYLCHVSYVVVLVLLVPCYLCVTCELPVFTCQLPVSYCELPVSYQ